MNPLVDYFTAILSECPSFPRSAIYLHLSNAENVMDSTKQLFDKFVELLSNKVFVLDASKDVLKEDILRIILTYLVPRPAVEEDEDSERSQSALCESTTEMNIASSPTFDEVFYREVFFPDIILHNITDHQITGIRPFKTEIRSIFTQRLIYLTNTNGELSDNSDADDPSDLTPCSSPGRSVTPLESNNTPNSSPRRKKRRLGTQFSALKACQEAKVMPSNFISLAQAHLQNTEVMKKTLNLQVDIIIFVSPNISFVQELCDFLGLIYIDQLCGETKYKPEVMEERLINAHARSWRLMQLLISYRLMRGYNNIAITQKLFVLNNTTANFKAAIRSDTSDGDLEVRCGDAHLFNTKLAINYLIYIKKKPQFIFYMEAIAMILEKAVGMKASIDTMFRQANETYKIKLPIIAVLPLYILRYRCQEKIKKMLEARKPNPFE